MKVFDGRKASGVARASRHKKKYWRKGTKARGVSDHVPRDNSVDNQVVDSLIRDDSSCSLGSTRPRTSSDIQKNLKCFQNLKSDPLIRPFPSAVMPKLLSMKNKKSKRLISKTVPVIKQHSSTKRQKNTDVYDIWQTEAPSEPERQGLDTRVVRHTMLNSGKSSIAVQKPTRSGRRGSHVPAVEVPHPGASYNPDFGDHQDLLSAAVVVEETKVKQTEKVQRALYVDPNSLVTPEDSLREECSGLPIGDVKTESDEEEEQDPEFVKLFIKKKVRGPDDRKTTSELNKKEKAKRKQVVRAERAEARQFAKQLKKINSIRKEVEREVTEAQLSVAERAKTRVQKRRKPSPNVGPQKYANAEVELKLSDELVSTLRQLKPEGNLLEDRYKSLQKRAVVPVGSLQKKRRSKVKGKMQERRSHRDVTADSSLIQ